MPGWCGRIPMDDDTERLAKVFLAELVACVGVALIEKWLDDQRRDRQSN